MNLVGRVALIPTETQATNNPNRSNKNQYANFCRDEGNPTYGTHCGIEYFYTMPNLRYNNQKEEIAKVVENSQRMEGYEPVIQCKR